MFTSNFKPLKLHSDFSPPSKIIKCKKIILLPTDHQKQSLLNMFEAYRLMYNATNKFLKEYFRNGNTTLPYWNDIRTLYMKDAKEEILNKFNVYPHTLDGAIKLCRTSYKAALTNLTNLKMEI
jgi:hypothetical protein